VLKMSASEIAVLIEIDGPGSHPAAGRVVTASTAELLSARWVTQSVHAAERAGFTAATFEDHPLPGQNSTGRPPRIDAIIRASFSAPQTSAIGLVPVAHVISSEPFHVATQLASLDTASLGRAGWIVGADADPAIAARSGREPLAADDVDSEVVDVVETVRRLWDSWEDDAVIRDKATGRYLDRDRLHYADFVGERFSVKGPSILPRSPQGQSVVVGHAGTAAEIDLALLDAPFDLSDRAGDDAGPSLAGVAAAAATAREQHGPDVRLVLQLEVALDRAARTGQERLAELDAHQPWRTDRHARYVGDAGGLTRLIVSLAGIVDGIRILPAVLEIDLDEVGRAVLPDLRALGLFTSPRVGATLRQTLGLAHPANRFAEVVR
jgi:alkanesulfonate monooxygenase SsuD/methylene tetrahydromethanopterin reductase-like flavin-dependent oxidoreductase (luciferase family)